MKTWQKLISHIWEIKLKKYHSPLNGNLYVNIEYGKKVLHTENSNFSFQKLHKVLSIAIKRVYKPDADRDVAVLNLGLGGGSTISILRDELGHRGHIISVEYDPVIIEIAKEDFDIDRYYEHTIINEDAMSFMAAQSIRGDSFDLIICDLFNDRTVPDKFKSQNFFNQLIVNISRGGSLIFNFIYEEGEEPFFIKYVESLSEEYSYEIIKPVPENSVLVLTRN